MKSAIEEIKDIFRDRYVMFMVFITSMFIIGYSAYQSTQVRVYKSDGVTCYFIYNTGISCLPDSQLDK